MDELKKPRKKADGIRKRASSPRARSVPATRPVSLPAREKIALPPLRPLPTVPTPPSLAAEISPSRPQTPANPRPQPVSPSLPPASLGKASPNVVAQSPVSPAQKQEIKPILPEKDVFFQRPAERATDPKDDGVIYDRSFKKEIAPVKSSFFAHKNIIALIAGLAVMGIAAILLSTVFSRVTITVKPMVESMQIENTQVFFDASVSDVSAATRTIPAEFLSFNGSASEDFDATGNDTVNQKATGHVQIYNAFGASPQALVATTRFITDTGIIFRVPKNIIIPAAKKDETGEFYGLNPQFIETDLVADKVGEGSNIAGEVKLHIIGFKGTPKYEGFYAVAKNGFSGGSVGKGIVVTHDDIVSAQQKVSKKAFDDLKQMIVQKIPAHFTYVDSLNEIEIASITAPKEKTKTDHFTVEVKAVARVFVFRDSDAIKLLNLMLLKSDDRKMFIEKSADFRYQIKNANYDKKIADVTMNGSIKTKKIISSDELTALVAGKKEGSLIEALKQRRDIATFRVAFFPPWLFYAPRNMRQIMITIEDPAVSQQ